MSIKINGKTLSKVNVIKNGINHPLKVVKMKTGETVFSGAFYVSVHLSVNWFRGSFSGQYENNAYVSVSVVAPTESEASQVPVKVAIYMKASSGADTTETVTLYDGGTWEKNPWAGRMPGSFQITVTAFGKTKKSRFLHYPEPFQTDFPYMNDDYVHIDK